MEYKEFKLKSERKDVIEIGHSMANYIHDCMIDNVIFADRSARPGYLALRGAWKNLFPEEPLPGIYFTNPEGYNTSNRSLDQVAEEFKQTYPKLSLDPESRLMLFDVCMHSGDTLKPIIEVLAKVGYDNIHVGLTQPINGKLKYNIYVDFKALPYHPDHEGQHPCYVFGRDNLVEKNRTSVLSSKNPNSGDRKSSIQIRKEISSLF